MFIQPPQMLHRLHQAISELQTDWSSYVTVWLFSNTDVVLELTLFYFKVGFRRELYFQKIPSYL